MITLFILFAGVFFIGGVIPFLFRLFFGIISLIFEIAGFIFLFTAIGFLGIIVFFAIDFLLLKLVCCIL